MVSVESMTGADRTGESSAASAAPSGLLAPVWHAPRTVLAQTHSKVCARRTSRRGHHTVSSRRHQQIGHRERHAAYRSRYSSGTLKDHRVAPHPRRRPAITCLVITVALGMLYLALIDIFGWNTHSELIWFGLLVIMFGGAVIENAIRLDGLTEQDGHARRPGRSAVAESTVTPGLPA